MSDKKYYYLRLKDFLDTEEFKILESQEDGYLYSNILMKMYLISLKKSERLALNGMIPYNVDMIVTLTGHCVEVVKEALKHLVKLGLIEMLSAGAVYMMDVQNYVCQSSNTEYKSKEEKADVEEYKPKKENELITQESLINTMKFANRIQGLLDCPREEKTRSEQDLTPVIHMKILKRRLNWWKNLIFLRGKTIEIGVQTLIGYVMTQI